MPNDSRALVAISMAGFDGDPRFQPGRLTEIPAAFR